MQYIAKISAVIALYSIAVITLTSFTFSDKKKKTTTKTCVSGSCQINGFHSPHSRCVYK